MPPNQRRSTGAFKMAESISVGRALALPSLRTFFISGESAICFSAREKTPPPLEMSVRS